METLTWTGTLGTYLDGLFIFALIVLLAAAACYFVATFTQDEPSLELAHTPFARTKDWTIGSATSMGELLFPAFALAFIIWMIDTVLSETTLVAWLQGSGMPVWFATVLAILVFTVIGLVLTYAVQRLPTEAYEFLVKWFFRLVMLVFVLYVFLGALMPLGAAGIVGGVSKQLIPVWIALIVTFTLSIAFKRKLGLYGKLFDSPVGMIGFGLVMFWVFTAFMGGPLDMIVTHDELSMVSGMKNQVPGTPLNGAEEGDYLYYLLGGDNLARDVFSRAVKGSWIVVVIAPAATVFAFMVGITLGLPAGYFGGKLDTLLSFLSNLILAFPVILLFFLLVTPEIVETGLPNYMATLLFVFPVIFLAVLLNSRYYTQPQFRNVMMAIVMTATIWLYLSMVSEVDTKVAILAGPIAWLDLFDVPSEILVVFVSVVFVNSPTVFRIVRGLTLDVKTRDYVAAAQTRGEGSWYIMLWEILPNVRGPLIVDFCLRIGYATILLGTLGFFGLGLESESPDWGSTINSGRRLLSRYLAPALVPALSLMSLVLGLNLLADGLREESLRD